MPIGKDVGEEKRAGFSCLGGSWGVPVSFDALPANYEYEELKAGSMLRGCTREG